MKADERLEFIRKLRLRGRDGIFIQDEALIRQAVAEGKRSIRENYSWRLDRDQVRTLIKLAFYVWENSRKFQYMKQRPIDMQFKAFMSDCIDDL